MNETSHRTRAAFLVALFLICITLPVAASEVPEEAPAGDMRDVMKERRDAYQESQGRPASTASFRERVTERRAEFAAGVKDRLKNLLSNVTGRLTALATRFENIADRIEVRADLLDQRGADTSAVRAALARADAEISLAQTLISETKESDIDQTVDDARPQDRFITVRERIVRAGGHLRTAHTALRDAVVALRSADAAPIAETVPPEDTATTTATSSPTI